LELNRLYQHQWIFMAMFQCASLKMLTSSHATGMAPHEDAMETKQRAVENLLTRLENGKENLHTSKDCNTHLLPGEQTSTRIEPAKSIYRQVAPASQQEGIVDAAIWVGYPWPMNPAIMR
jgi:microcystin degradation protein MlrC